MREPPDDESRLPSEMTDRELDAAHRALAAWVEEALSATPTDAPPDDVYDSVYARLAAISRERVERQRDDRRGFPRKPLA